MRLTTSTLLHVPVAIAISVLPVACGEIVQQPNSASTTPVDNVNQNEIKAVIERYLNAYNNADTETMSDVAFGYVLYGIQHRGDGYRKDVADSLAQDGKVVIDGYREFSSMHPERASIVVTIHREKLAPRSDRRFSMIKLKGQWRINQIENL